MSLSPNASNGVSRMSGSYKWWVVAMLWWIAFFNYADRQAIFSVFPLLQKEMSLTNTQLGLLGSSFGLIYGLGAPFAGLVIDRIRRKTAILSGLHIWSIICMATALSQNFRHLFLFRAAEGLGETFYFPASMSLVSDYHGKKTRSRAMGFHQTSVYIGTIAGGFFAGMIGQYYGWRWSFIVFGGLGVVLGVVLRAFLKEPVRGAADREDLGVDVAAAPAANRLSPFRVFLLILKTPTALLLMLAFMCANFVATIYLSWMAKFVYDRFAMGLAAAGLTATIFFQLASMVGSPVGGWFADGLRQRMAGGRLMVQAFGVFCGAPFVVLCGLAPSLTVLIVALLGWGFFKGLYDANIFASVYDVIPPEARGTAAGVMNCCGWLVGGVLGPLVAGFVADQSNLGSAIAIAAPVYLVAGILLLIGAFAFIRRDTERMQASVSASS